jgi:hypothetical protein
MPTVGIKLLETMAALIAGAPGAGRRDVVAAIAARTALVASADRRLSLHGVVAVVGGMQPAMEAGADLPSGHPGHVPGLDAGAYRHSDDLSVRPMKLEQRYLDGKHDENHLYRQN